MVGLLIFCILGLTDAARDINDIINDVTLRDKHYFNDLQPEVYSGIAILGKEIVNVTFKVGQGYQGQVIEEESELIEKRTDSLKKAAILIKYQPKFGTKCWIRIAGGQLVRNYIRLYRTMKEVEETRPTFIKLEVRRRKTGEKILIPLLQNVKQSKESLFKYLPYQLTHLPDLYMLTVSQDIQARSFITYEMSVSDGCLPLSPEEREERKQDKESQRPQGENETNASASQSKTALPSAGELKNQSLNHCNPNIDVPDNVTTCYDVNYDVTPTLRHLYMMSIQMQHLFFMRYHGSIADDTEVCSVTLLAGAASSTKANFEHTMVECCNVIIGRQKLFRAGELEQGWHCHDPYHLSKLLLQLVGYASYVIMALLPMAITVLPSVAQRGKQEEEENTEYVKTDAESVISEITGKRLKDVHVSNTPPDGTPETLSLNQSDDEEDKPDKIFVKVENDKTETSQDSPKYDLIFVNEDPVYQFGLDTIVWYLLLFNIKSHYLTVARRIVFLYFLWVLHYLATLQMYLFYINIYLYTWQVKIPSLLSFHVYNPNKAYDTESQFHSVFLVYVLIVPTLFALAQFVLLSPLLTDSRSIAEVLYWDENSTEIGAYMEIDLVDNAYDFNLPFEVRLVQTLSARMSYISKVKFWRYLFRNAIFEINCARCKSPKFNFCLKGLVKFIVMVLIWPFYVLPILTVFRNFFTNNPKTRPLRCKLHTGLKRFLMVLGWFSLILLFLPFIFCYVCMLLFIVIDIFRNLTATLTAAIFILSILGSLRDALISLEDEYRTIKVAIFNIVESFAESEDEKEMEYHKVLIWSSDSSGDVALPKALFDQVCAIHMPFGPKVTGVIISLCRNLLFIALLYALIVDYQIFDQFSETGESIITVIFVMLPSLMSREKSEAELELGNKETELKLKVVVMGVLESSEFWAELKGAGKEVETMITSV